MPAQLMTAWNFDPLLIAVIFFFAFVGFRQAQSRFEHVMVIATTLVALIAFVSPLCALTSALFAARGLHHIIVASILCPMIIFSSRSSTHIWDRLCLIPPEAAFLFSTAIFWLWHMPFAYSFALSGTLAYWIMQLALIGAQLLLFAQLLSQRSTLLTKLSLSVATMIQMGFLSALLTFAPYPLFDEHLTTTFAFGINALTDQQLSGIFMWTLGLLPYLFISLSSLRQFLQSAPQMEQE